eukprot:scaffold16904_cov101-Isochrysis_galbana.AAC.5
MRVESRRARLGAEPAAYIGCGLPKAQATRSIEADGFVRGRPQRLRAYGARLLRPEPVLNQGVRPVAYRQEGPAEVADGCVEEAAGKRAVGLRGQFGIHGRGEVPDCVLHHVGASTLLRGSNPVVPSLAGQLHLAQGNKLLSRQRGQVPLQTPHRHPCPAFDIPYGRIAQRSERDLALARTVVTYSVAHPAPAGAERRRGCPGRLRLALGIEPRRDDELIVVPCGGLVERRFELGRE